MVWKLQKKKKKKKKKELLHLLNFLVKLLILIVISLHKSLACLYALWNVLIVFEKIICKKFCKNSNILKYYYNLKLLFLTVVSGFFNEYKVQKNRRNKIFCNTIHVFWVI